MKGSRWLILGGSWLGSHAAFAVDPAVPATVPAYDDAKQTVGSDDEGRDVGAGIGSCNFGGKTEKMSPSDCALHGGLWHARSLDSSAQGKRMSRSKPAH